MARPSDASQVEARRLPADAVCCPQCSSPDTAKYTWPNDPHSQLYAMRHPNTRICVDCHHVWWTD